MFYTNLTAHPLQKYLLLSLTGILLNSGCITDKRDASALTKDNDEAVIEEPVYRDWAEIKNSGVLRMITSYSSGTYFLYKGIQVGFEYEMLKQFTQENDLALEVVVIGPGQNPFTLLNKGEGDIIAASYTITPERQKLVDFTRTYNLVDQQIIVSEELGFVPESIYDLEGIPITVRKNSSYHHRLKELKKEGIPVEIHVVSEETDTEAILYQVSAGRYKATVADDNLFNASSTYINGLVTGPLISENDQIAWAVRKNAPDLKNALDKYLYKHFRFSEEGLPKRSAFLNVLRKKYFEGGFQAQDYYFPYQEGFAGAISPFDNLIKEVAAEYNLDWLMLTAIAAQESRFNPESKSWAGAVGIMQVLPQYSEIPPDSLYIPEINIREGAKILAEHLHHYSYLDTLNQWSFALAAYNAGAGHLADARRLSIDHNENPNEWEYVSKSLLRLMQRKYYQNARYGFCRGIETVRYVNEILNRYKTYKDILALAEPMPIDAPNSAPGILGMMTF